MVLENQRLFFQELIENNPKVVELLLNYAILLGKDMRNTEDANQLLQKADLLDQSGRYTKKIKAIRQYLKTKKADKQGHSDFLYLG